jgi:outer membrane protein TolC
MNRAICAVVILLSISTAAFAQTDPQTSQVDNQSNAQAPVTITLQDAIARAKKLAPDFHAVLTDYGVAKQDRAISRAALLPTVTGEVQYLYTQPLPGPGNVPRFIANNGAHEYIAQGNAHQSLSLIDLANYRRSVALQEVARAKADIAARGLIVTVVGDYYGFVVSQRKYSTAQLAATEAQNFLDVTRKLENGGEVAHSDTIKAQLQFNDKQIALREAQLGMERTRVALALLLFPDFNQNFSVVDDLRLPDAVPPFEEVARLAKVKNPDLAQALATMHAGQSEVLAARAGYLPTFAFDYWYGIDANHFAVRTDGFRNLGYAAAATMNLPVWNWGATHAKVKQGILHRDQAQLELSFAQKKLLGQLQNLYQEAEAASAETDMLRQSAQLAADSLRLTTLRYQGGESTVLEVVDAQNTLATARNAYDDGEVRYRTALANLQTLTGSL